MCDKCEAVVPIQVQFCRLREQGQIPTFGNDDIMNAGMDFYSADRTYIEPGDSEIVGLGIGWQVSNPRSGYKYEIMVQSRSGLAFKKGIEASNAGVVDHNYRQEIKVKLYNHSKHRLDVYIGDRVCQGIVYQLPITTISEVDKLTPTDRGEGFGSSGIK